MEKLLQIVPPVGSREIPWQQIESLFGDILEPMAQTPQNPRWHGEGNVWTHTKMVVQELCKLPGYQALDREKQQILFLAALFHDVGKPLCTRLEDGAWVSRGHGRVGASILREKLWLSMDICGTPQKQQLRETVCRLIQYHSTPPHAIDDPDGKRRLLKIAANGEQTPLFTIELLCLLSQADILGRISADQTQLLEKVELCRELAKEADCFDKPFAFASAYSRYAYLSGSNMLPQQPLYDPTWGEVIMLSGLPGVGKDTWIAENYPHLPVICLDDIRQEMDCAPTKNQAAVAEEAHRRAKELLRKKQSFIWNATDLSFVMRQKQLSLFTSYAASVKIVYLETDWQEQLRRNSSRSRQVPVEAIEKMLQKLEPPQIPEARAVIWQCV